MASRALIELREGADGRWYWHRIVNGRVTADGNTASRRSARRSVLRQWPGIKIVVLG